MADAGRAIVQFQGDYSQLTSGLASALAPAKMGKMGKMGGLAVGGAFAAAIGGAAIAKALYNLGSDFDKAYDKIRVSTGKTGKQLEALKSDFKSVYAEVPAGMDDVAAAIGGLNAHLGLTKKPLRAMAQQMVELSEITGNDLERNIVSVSKAFEAWKVPIKEQTDALDGLFRLQQSGGGTVADLADNMMKFSSPLRTLKFDVGEAAAMFAAFERGGVNTQTMLPGLKFAIANMSDPTADLATQFKKLGIEADKPGAGLKKLFSILGNKSTLDTQHKINLAMAVFGRRAGSDMKDAIQQGRFDLDRFIGIFKDGKDSIHGAATDTRDFSENAKILGHRLQNIVEPAASGLYSTLGDLSGALVDLTKQSKKGGKGGGGVDGFFDRLGAKGQDAAAAAGILKAAYMALKPVWQITLEKVKDVILRFRGLWSVIRGFTKVLSIFKGDWRKAMWGVADIVTGSVKIIVGTVRGMVKPTLAPVKLIARGLKSVFGGAWDSVESVFISGGNAVIDVINAIIEAINAIPGVPNINPVGSIGGPGIPNNGPAGPSGSRAGGTGAKYGGTKKQRGGTLLGGKPSGDSIPALLERGEYVLNREAVKKVGVQNLDHLNFKKAARFQTGGRIGLINGGDAWDAAKSAVGKVTGKASGFFIDKLPKPNIPEPFTGVGPYVIKAATEYIKSHVADIVPGGTKGPDGIGTYNGLPMANWVIESLKYAASKGVAPTPTSGYRSHAYNVAQGRNYFSEHEGTQYPHGAVDFGGYTTGYDAKMSVVNATSGFKYPLLAPIGFEDDGHASGTGHQKGGLIGRLRRMISGGAVVKQAAPILARKGFDFKAIAGILGNAYGESNWNTEAMEPGTDNGGLFGFTAYEKSMDSLRAFAGRIGEPWSDVRTQILFMLSSGGMSTKSAMNALDSIPATTEYFMSDYERPGIPRLDVRTQGAFMAAKIMKGMSLGKSGLEGEAFGGSGKAGFGSAIGDPSAKQTARSHKHTLSKIKARGLSYPFKDKLMGMEGILGQLAEQLDVAEQNASAEWGPGGSELTEGEKGKQVGFLRSILMNQGKKRDWLVKSIHALYAAETAIINQRDRAKPANSKTHWKYAALSAAAKGTRRSIGALTDNFVDLVGLTGDGGEMFSTNMSLKSLGAASTVESASAAARDAELVDLMREQLGLANRNNAILAAQTPIYEQFLPKYHTGGIIPPGGEQPIMAKGGEGVFTRDQMAAMGGGSPTVVIEIADGAGVDPAMIDARINGQLVNAVRKTRTGGPAAGRKYVTNG